MAGRAYAGAANQDPEQLLGDAGMQRRKMENAVRYLFEKDINPFSVLGFDNVTRDEELNMGVQSVKSKYTAKVKEFHPDRVNARIRRDSQREPTAEELEVAQQSQVLVQQAYEGLTAALELKKYGWFGALIIQWFQRNAVEYTYISLRMNDKMAEKRAREIQRAREMEQAAASAEETAARLRAALEREKKRIEERKRDAEIRAKAQAAAPKESEVPGISGRLAEQRARFEQQRRANVDRTNYGRPTSTPPRPRGSAGMQGPSRPARAKAVFNLIHEHQSRWRSASNNVGPRSSNSPQETREDIPSPPNYPPPPKVLPFPAWIPLSSKAPSQAPSPFVQPTEPKAPPIFSPPKRMPVEVPLPKEPPAKAPRKSYNKIPPKAAGEQKESTAHEDTPVYVPPCQSNSAQEEQPAPPADDPEERKRQKAESAEPPPTRSEPPVTEHFDIFSSDDDDDWKRPVRSPSPKPYRTEPKSYAPPDSDKVTGSVMPGVNALDRSIHSALSQRARSSSMMTKDNKQLSKVTADRIAQHLPKKEEVITVPKKGSLPEEERRQRILEAAREQTKKSVLLRKDRMYEVASKKFATDHSKWIEDCKQAEAEGRPKPDEPTPPSIRGYKAWARNAMRAAMHRVTVTEQEAKRRSQEDAEQSQPPTQKKKKKIVNESDPAWTKYRREGETWQPPHDPQMRRKKSENVAYIKRRRITKKLHQRMQKAFKLTPTIRDRTEVPPTPTHSESVRKHSDPRKPIHNRKRGPWDQRRWKGLGKIPPWQVNRPREESRQERPAASDQEKASTGVEPRSSISPQATQPDDAQAQEARSDATGNRDTETCTSSSESECDSRTPPEPMPTDQKLATSSESEDPSERSRYENERVKIWHEYGKRHPDWNPETDPDWDPAEDPPVSQEEGSEPASAGA